MRVEQVELVDFEKRKEIFWQNYQFAIDKIERDVSGLIRVLLIPEMYNDKIGEFYDPEMNRMIMEELNRMSKKEEEPFQMEKEPLDLFQFYKRILLNMKTNRPEEFISFKQRAVNVMERQQAQTRARRDDLNINVETSESTYR